MVHTCTSNVPQFHVRMLSRAKSLFTNLGAYVMGLLNFVIISASEHGVYNI